MIFDYVAGSGDNSYVSCVRSYGSMHTVRRRNRPVQISQLSRLRFNMEGAEGSGSTRQGLEASSDSLADQNPSSNPEILVNIASTRQRCLDPTSVQRLIVDREPRTRSDMWNATAGSRADAACIDNFRRRSLASTSDLSSIVGVLLVLQHAGREPIGLMEQSG
jgi:hypothetical protein